MQLQNCIQNHGDILSAWLHSENWPEMVLKQPCSSYLNNSKWIVFSLEVLWVFLNKETLPWHPKAMLPQYCQKNQRIWRSYICFRNICKPALFKSYCDWNSKNSVFPSNSASHIVKTVCNWMQDLVSRRLLLGKSLKWVDLCMANILGRILKLGHYKLNMGLLVNETHRG